MGRRTITAFIGRRSAVALAFFCLAVAEPARATFIVSSWQLADVAQNFATGQQDTQASITVENPFVQNQTAFVAGNLFASSNYNLSWDDSGGSFHVDISQQALDPPPSGAFSSSGAFIFVQSSIDALLTVSGSYSYSLPPDMFFARLTTYVRDTTTNQIIWGQNPSANSFGGQFVSGTLNVGNNGLFLTGGHPYILHYDFLLQTGGGGTNGIGTGDGSIQWTITVLPECVTISLFMPALAFLVRRRGRR